MLPLQHPLHHWRTTPDLQHTSKTSSVSHSFFSISTMSAPKTIEIVVPALAISEHTVKIVASTLTVLDPTVTIVTSTLIGPEPTFTTTGCPEQQVISYCRNNAFTWPPPHRWSALYWCVVTMSAMFVIYAYVYSLGPLKMLRTRPKGKTEEKVRLIARG